MTTPHTRGRRARNTTLWTIAAGVCLVWTVSGSGINVSDLAEGRDGAARMADGFLRPDLSPDMLVEVVRSLAQTIQIAVTGLLLASVAGFAMAVAMAGNVGLWPPSRILIRAVAAVCRGVPDLVWALLLVAAVGPGPAAGTLAIAVHGAGMLAKLCAEQLESVNPAPVEAVRLAGASRTATAALAILPQARTGIASVVLYQLECNIRASTVLGFVGAGGLGQELAISLRLFRYDEVGTIVLAILAVMLAVDSFSRWARGRLGADVQSCT